MSADPSASTAPTPGPRSAPESGRPQPTPGPELVPGTPFAQAVDRVRDGGDPDAEADSLLSLMTASEQLALLHGNVPFWRGRRSIMHDGYNHFPYPAGANARLGVPGIHFIDGPRGVVVGSATAFPVSMARGATWDPDLEERIGRAIGQEVRASGGNFFGGVCINLPRHPAWGRVQETYSDQSVLLGAMGAALTRGVSVHAIACVKHFALNSMENARFDVDVHCDPETLHEDFLPHFHDCVRAGAGSLMCAYNRVNGQWASASQELLTEVLREKWGFTGFTISDFIWAIRDAGASLEAGLDVETPFAQLRAEHLPDALATGEASRDTVRTSGRRLLRTLLDHYARRCDERPPAAVIASDEHRALAREAAARSMVLLRNEAVADAPALPLDPVSLRSLAVVGRLADVQNLGDRGSSNVHAHQVTPLAGLCTALPGARVTHDDGADPDRAAALAAESDAAVVVVGYTAAEEGEWVNGRIYARDDLMRLYPEPHTAEDQAVLGEMMDRLRAAAGKAEIGGDRANLHLPPEDVALIRAVSAAQPRTAVVIVAAGAVLMEEWFESVPAVVMGWYSGMEGGHALADLLLGAENFSGRMPYAIPRRAEDLPEFRADAAKVGYDRWYGQRLLARRGAEALIPLGRGLSYTTFTLMGLDLDVNAADGRVRARTTVRNTGTRDGIATIQLYATRLDGDRVGQRELLGFTRVGLDPGRSATAVVDALLRPLSRWDRDGRKFILPAGRVRFEAGQFWGDPDAVSAAVAI
ncbi:beta-glucosidase [Actinomyces sp.]|uniref:beta-glucosidase family protein n=1 Tax=Actinomyces sp. TaxID=29317 RepID=UPI0026DD802A|nr:glycoside hydrolase family 3 C-terminal domain-containing protein [Actinomyces sp.]MDO4901026.1 glycoside hydrolase family 3 C-terminal domain-containing protein [Actinomyces sp.]